MIPRFRPTYSYSDLFFSFFQDVVKDTKNVKKTLCEIYGTPHVFLFNKARVAIYCLLKSLNLNGGVISPAYNCIVVPDAIRYAGLDNQFADISLDDFNMTANTVQKVITSQSKVLLATHQFGIPCDIEAFKYISKKNNLYLFEDAAGSMGAKINNRNVGTFSKAAVISFQDTKVLNAVNGGCLLIFDDKLAKKVKELSIQLSLLEKILTFEKALSFKILTSPTLYSILFPIWVKIKKSYTNAEETNYRKPKDYVSGLNSFSLSLISRQIKNYEDNLITRKEIGNFYLDKLKNTKGIVLPSIKKGLEPSWSRFPVRFTNKKLEFEKIFKKGVDMAWTFSYICPTEKMELFPNSIKASNQVLDLPIYNDISFQDTERVVITIKKSLNEK